MGRIRTIMLVVVVMALMPLAPAAAHRKSHVDSNESPSRLDLRKAVVSHNRSVLKFKISTWESWQPSELRRDRWFSVWIKTARNDEYVVGIHYRRGRLRAPISLPGETSKRVGTAAVKKVSPRAFLLKVPRSLISARSGFRWMGMSQWTSGSGACSPSCLDYMPGGTGFSGMFRRHQI